MDQKAMLNAEISAPDGNVPEWIMVARTGMWLGHPRAPEVITGAHLQSAIAEFSRNYAAYGADLVVDYHHASVRAVTMMDGKAPAAGWIRAMELRNNSSELWGRVEWTAEAAAAIARREYRRLSPVLRFGRPDRITGEPLPLQIHSVALTNTPFMTDLESLNSNADATDGAGQTPQTVKGGKAMSLIDSLAAALGNTPEQVTSALGLEGDADDSAIGAAILAKLTRVTELEAQIAAAPEVPADVANALGIETPDLKAVRVEILRLRANADLTPFANALGLADTAGAQDMLNAISELQVSRRKTDAEALVDDAIEAGKIPPAQRALWLNAAETDLDSAGTVINGLPVLTAPRGLAGRGADVPGDGLTDAEQQVARRMGHTKEAMIAARK